MTNKIRQRKITFALLLTILAISGMFGCATYTSCSDNAAGLSDVSKLAEQLWTYSRSHPDGFTIDIRDMSEPAEGIAVSYAATQGSHSRDQLDDVIRHALEHDGYVGGWYNDDDGLYYFDSSRLFPEDSLSTAVKFGQENRQHSIFVLSNHLSVPLDGKVAEIIDRGKVLVGTTGDYRPLSFREPGTGEYWGFGIELAQEFAKYMNVSTEYVATSWPTLTADVLAEPQTFDFAIGGITITDARKETMLMSDGYLGNGKTILCRAEDAGKYQSLADINRPEVRVMVNPGGLNEKFANENLTQATIIVHQKNEEIPSLVAEGQADIMITEITEAPYYVQTDSRLAAPLLNAPFTKGQIGVLMRKGQNDLMDLINSRIEKMKSDGSLRSLHEKYGMVYSFEGS